MNGNPPYGAFVSRDYRYFFAARLANSVGTNFMMPASGWQIYALTRDPFALGMIGMAVFVPVVLSSLPAGKAADRLERRRVYQIAQVVLTVSAFSFCALTVAHVTSPWTFYLGAALFGRRRPSRCPTATAWMPHLVPREHFLNAVVWTSSTCQISSVVGPTLVGVSLYAVGEAPTYALAAGCYLLSLVRARMVGTHGRGADVQRGGLARVFAGFTYISDNRLTLGATTLDLFALFLGGATAMLPVYAYIVAGFWQRLFPALRDVDGFEQAMPARDAPIAYAPRQAAADVTAALAVEDILEARVISRLPDTDGIRAPTVARLLSRRNFEIAILRHPFSATAAQTSAETADA